MEKSDYASRIFKGENGDFLREMYATSREAAVQIKEIQRRVMDLESRQEKAQDTTRQNLAHIFNLIIAGAAIYFSFTK
jgi:Na+/proline symporter